MAQIKWSNIDAQVNPGDFDSNKGLRTALMGSKLAFDQLGTLKAAAQERAKNQFIAELRSAANGNPAAYNQVVPDILQRAANAGVDVAGISEFGDTRQKHVSDLLTSKLSQDNQRQVNLHLPNEQEAELGRTNAETGAARARIIASNAAAGASGATQRRTEQEIEQQNELFPTELSNAETRALTAATQATTAQDEGLLASQKVADQQSGRAFDADLGRARIAWQNANPGVPIEVFERDRMPGIVNALKQKHGLFGGAYLGNTQQGKYESAVNAAAAERATKQQAIELEAEIEELQDLVGRDYVLSAGRNGTEVTPKSAYKGEKLDAKDQTGQMIARYPKLRKLAGVKLTDTTAEDKYVDFQKRLNMLLNAKLVNPDDINKALTASYEEEESLEEFNYRVADMIRESKEAWRGRAKQSLYNAVR